MIMIMIMIMIMMILVKSYNVHAFIGPMHHDATIQLHLVCSNSVLIIIVQGLIRHRHP